MLPPTHATEASLSTHELIDELFARHYRASFLTANRILRSTEDAEDAVQTAYCAAFRHFDTFRGESSFKTWITRIVVNCCLIQLRERRARKEFQVDDVERTEASHAATPELLCYFTELQAAHVKAASRLPKLLYAVYAESVIQEEPLSKASVQLGLTTAAAKSRLFRARKSIEHTLLPVLQRRAA